MFYRFSLLTKISDISNWNLENVENTNHMFDDCLSLISLPEISKWNTNNFKYMNSMFRN